MSGKVHTLDPYKILCSPTRRKILLRCAAVESSATEVAEETGEKFHTVAAHFRVLAESGFIKLVDTDRRLGGLQKFYRLDTEGLARAAGSEGEDLILALVAVARAARAQRIPESLQRSLLNVGRMLELVAPANLEQVAGGRA